MKETISIRLAGIDAPEVMNTLSNTSVDILVNLLNLLEMKPNNG